MNTFSEVIIFTPDKLNDNMEQRRRKHKQAKCKLRKRFNYKPVKGMFNKVMEDSYSVIINNKDDLEFIKQLATNFKQHSVLYIDANRYASLISPCSGEIIENLGMFRSVDKSMLKSLKNYTYDMLNDTYYSTFKIGDR